MPDCFDPCQPIRCLPETPTTDNMTYAGETDACVNVSNGMLLTDALRNIITFLKNRLFNIVSDSMVVSELPTTCDRVKRIEIVPSTDAGNIFVLGTDNFPYVPATTPSALTCAELQSLFGVDREQNNTIDPTTYNFYGVDDNVVGACKAIKFSAPTGFAVTGNTRVSAFGKMEWFDTLTLANAAAAAGETVLIFNDTVENLIIKDNVNYYSIGQHSVGSVSTSGVVVARTTLSNITITGALNVGGNTTIINENVIVLGVAAIIGDAKWTGGSFLDTTTNMGIGGNAIVSHIFSNKRITVVENAILTQSTIEENGVIGAFFAAVNIGTPTPNTSNLSVNNCYISSINNIGVITVNGGVSITNNTIKVKDSIGLYIHGGGFTTAIKTVVTNNHVSNEGNILVPQPSMLLYRVSAGTPSANNGNFDIANNTCYSINGYGVLSILGSMNNCDCYSENNIAILVDSQEEQGFDLGIIDCKGESKNSNGIKALRDIFIIGGTYISRLNTGAGNPIVVSNTSQNGVANLKYKISGVTTIAKSPVALAIKALAPLTVGIGNCNFICEGQNNVPAAFTIDPTITLLPVAIDAYGNIR